MPMRRNPNNTPTMGREDLPRIKEPEILRCPSCNCSYFEQIKVAQYPRVHTVVLGQGIPPTGAGEFCVLRCARCNELLEPNVFTGARDAARAKYDLFLDEMEERGKADESETF